MIYCHRIDEEAQDFRPLLKSNGRKKYSKGDRISKGRFHNAAPRGILITMKGGQMRRVRDRGIQNVEISAAPVGVSRLEGVGADLVDPLIASGSDGKFKIGELGKVSTDSISI